MRSPFGKRQDPVINPALTAASQSKETQQRTEQRISIAQLFSYEKYLDPSRNSASSCNNSMAADTVWRKAISAFPGVEAGGIFGKPLGIGGRGNVLDPFVTGGNIGNQFIHACDNDHIAWALDEAGDAVAIAVNIDQLALQCDGIGAHEVVISKDRPGKELTALLIAFGKGSVDQGITAGAYRIHQAAFLNGFAAAPADRGAVLHKLQDCLYAGCAVLEEKAIHSAFVQIFDGGLCCGFKSKLFGCHILSSLQHK